MNTKERIILVITLGLLATSFLAKQEIVTMYLIGDSTVADYSDNYDEGKDYMKTRYPVTGWGQVFQQFMAVDSLKNLKHIVRGDSVVVDDRARGGRSTRTFFQEGRWRSVYDNLKKNDIVMIQFGHNDAAENKPERYVNIEGYKEFLRLYITQTLQKGAIPIVLTPVNRNYPWKDGQLENVHGEYPQAATDVAKEYGVQVIDLTQRSIDAFTAKGKEYVTNNYFMNLPAGKYEAYPEGESDNTHFQPEGAKAVAQLVFDGLKELRSSDTRSKD